MQELLGLITQVATDPSVTPAERREIYEDTMHGLYVKAIMDDASEDVQLAATCLVAQTIEHFDKTQGDDDIRGLLQIGVQGKPNA